MLVHVHASIGSDEGNSGFISDRSVGLIDLPLVDRSPLA